MAMLFESLITEIILIVGLVYLYFYRAFTYWARLGIPYIKPEFPFGTVKNLVLRREALPAYQRRTYEQLKKQGAKYGGHYVITGPVFTPIHPNIIKQMLVEDFSCFQDRGLYTNEKGDPLSATLISLQGESWKNLRQKLTPMFTPAKMKSMFETFVSCGDILETTLTKILTTDEPIDIKDIAARFTTDIISSCAFGLQTSCLINPDDDFRKYGRIIFENRTSKDFLLRLFFHFIPRCVFRFFNIKVTKPAVSKFFLNIVKQTLEYREKNKIQRNDILDLLINLKNGGSTNDEAVHNSGNNIDSITFNEIARQCYGFYITGFETSSATITFALYELCQHQDIQDKLRKEVKVILKKYKGKLTYDAVHEMRYMDKVVNGNYINNGTIPFRAK